MTGLGGDKVTSVLVRLGQKGFPGCRIFFFFNLDSPGQSEMVSSPAGGHLGKEYQQGEMYLEREVGGHKKQSLPTA